MDVVCALLIQKQKILLAQRPLQKKQGGLWEFPGGKINSGETAEQALRRELNEELKLDSSQEPLSFLGQVSHKDIHLQFFFLNLKTIYSPQEHRAVAWLNYKDLTNHSLCPSDKIGTRLYREQIIARLSS